MTEKVKEEVLLATENIPLKFFKRGKVRDIYELDGKLLIVATDRISCFDVVLSEGIPYKGKVLTQISKFWFEYLKDLSENPLVLSNGEEFRDAWLASKAVEVEGEFHPDQTFHAAR